MQEEEERKEGEDLAVPTIPRKNQTTPIEVTNTSNKVGPSGSGRRALEAYITVNGRKAKALFHTGTMGDNLVSEKFISTFQISTQDLDTPISLKMAVEESRTTIDYKSEPVIQVAAETGDTTVTIPVGSLNTRSR